MEIFNIHIGTVDSIDGLPELDSDLLKIAKTEVQNVAKLGQQALKTAAPVYTGALRNSVKITGGDSDRQVVIEETSHYSGFGTTELADILDRGPYRRSQQSVREGPFDSIVKGAPTAEWVERAAQDLETYLAND